MSQSYYCDIRPFSGMNIRFVTLIEFIIIWICSSLKDQNGKVLEILSLIIEPPDSSLYLPNAKDSDEVIRGGPHLKGFLPYHKRLASTVSTTGPTMQCNGDKGAQLIVDQGILVGTYAGWLGRDNMGDEIVSDLFFDLLVARIIKEVKSRKLPTCVSISRARSGLSAQGSRGCTLENSSSCDFAVLGGGSTVYVDYVKHISGAIRASKPILLFGSGHQSGLRKKSTTDKYMNLLCTRSLLGGVRGSYTQAYLKRYGCNITRIVRDSALLAQRVYPEGRTILRPQLKELIGGAKPRHLIVATLKSSPRCLSVYNSTLRPLVRITTFYCEFLAYAA